MDGPPAWGLGVGLTTPARKIIRLLRKITRSLVPGRIPWINDLNKKDGHEIWYVEC
jgi:hypothetical protein